MVVDVAPPWCPGILGKEGGGHNHLYQFVDLDIATWTFSATNSGPPDVVLFPRQSVTFLANIKPIGADPGSSVFTNSSGGPLANWDRRAKAIMAASHTNGWTRHDLRRTGATMLGDMGELPDIIEAALNHVSIHSRLATTQNRSRYRPQVAAALRCFGGNVSLPIVPIGCAPLAFGARGLGLLVFVALRSSIPVTVF